MNPYDELGVPPDADDVAIKRAYRKRASKAHPDKGGDKEAMARLNQAYALLSDNGRRAEYDATGKVDAEQDEATRVAMTLTGIFLHMVDTMPLHENIIVRMRHQITSDQGQQVQQINIQKQKIAKLHKVRDKIRKKTPGENRFACAIDSQVAQLERALVMMEEHVTFGSKLLEALNDYEFDTEVATWANPIPHPAFGRLGV